MKRNIFTYLISAAASLAALAGCAGDKTDTPGGGDGVPVEIGGIISRAGTVTEAPIYLMAFGGDDPDEVYFSDAIIRTGSALREDDPEDFTFVNGMKYYPLGGREINLFAYTGPLDGSYRMELTAGTAETNDYILSNYGSRVSDGRIINDSYEGSGTPGSSTDPAEILEFRHVMTQLTIEVVVDKDESNYVDPAPEKVEFRIDGMRASGLYSIRNKTPQVYIDAGETVAVASGNGAYTVKYTPDSNVNYLVPTGLNLAGQKFSSLVIDDYEATAADLSEFVIEGTQGESEMYLYPGYAYTLTLTIRKLRLVGVELKQVEWRQVGVNGTDPTYDPAQLELNITGGYDNTGEDKITKLVLHSADGKQYVGDADDADDLINYVTLPQSGVDSIDLYTDKGLLLSMDVPAGGYDYASGTLSIELPETGMLLETPGSPNSPTNRYLITTVAQFLNVSKDLGGYYLQMADIELEEPRVHTTDFTGFGPFSGTYEGNGYWIGHANFTSSGLFSENTATGKLINIRIYTGNMDLSAGTTYAGSICAVNYGLIYACVNEASLFDAPATVGGICGLNETTGRIIACLNTGNIRSGTVQGGICGENRNTSERTFAACLNTGDLSDISYPIGGGIVGVTSDSNATVIGTCFWLEGSAQVMPGQPETAAGQGTVGQYDTTYLDPSKMRNGLDYGETDPDDRVVTRLNAEISGLTGIPGGYRYVFDEVVTGITWPMPYDVNQIP